MGTKIMAVLLAAVVALPSAGTVMAAEPAPAESVSEDANESGKSLWDSLFRSAYPKSDSTDEGKNSGSNSDSNSGSNSGIGEVKVKLSVAVAEGIVYGDSLVDKITVTATNLKDNTKLENFKEYELKYYDKDKKALAEAPKDAGDYYVEAVVKEDSDKYKGDTSEQAAFTIEQKSIKLVLEDQRIDINKDDKLPETYLLKLAEDSSLAYDETFQEGYPNASYKIMKDGEEIKEDPLPAGKYTLVVQQDSIELKLAGNAKAENYQIAPVEDAELIAADMLKLEVTGDKEFQYGDFDDSKFLKSAVTAVNSQEEEETLEEDRISLKYYDAEDKELSELPRNAGKYKVMAVYEYDEKDHKAGESEKVSFEITKRKIDFKLDSFRIEIGAAYPTEEELNEKLIITGLVEVEEEGKKKEKLPYEDKWKIEPKVYYKDETIDTNKVGLYNILIEAELDENCASNYDLATPDPLATMIVGDPEVIVKLEDVSVEYGAKADEIERAVKEKITTYDKEENPFDTPAADLFSVKYFNEDESVKLDTVPLDAGTYKVRAAYIQDGFDMGNESEAAVLTIAKREIVIKTKSYYIKNGGELPEKLELAVDEIKLSHEDQWAEGGEPKAVLEGTTLEEIDTKVGKDYVITVSAAVEDSRKDNYNIIPENGQLCIAELTDNGKSRDVLKLAEDAVTSKIYDGKPFENPAVTSKFGYDTSKLEYIWSTSDGKAPKDAGSYKMNIRIPDSDPDWEGSMEVDLTIEKATVTATAVPVATETYAGEPVKCNIETGSLIDGDQWIRQPKVKVTEGDVNKAGSYKVQATGGDAGNNYTITYGEPVSINVLAERKPVISSVKFGKKDTYTAKYTGEQIRPAVTVTCNYVNEKGKAATQKLKLNVDYMVSYSENVNAGTASVTVQGIGEYAGVITKDFTITPKEMKKVTLSAVGDIKIGDTPTLVVMDGNYELSPDDYDIIVKTEKNGSFKPLSEVTCGPKDILEKVELKVKAREGSNYTGESSKKAKFNILGSEINATPIADITFDLACLKIPAKGYTYNGKTQKPKVTVKGADGKKLKSSEFKVVYSGNVNAGLAKVQIVGLYNKKKNTGYYGVSEPVYFEIKQKSFKKVSVSSVAAIPKSGSLESITLTVKDGKRILTEGLDYWVDYSNIVDDKTGQILSDKITVGQKYDVTLYAYDGGNYLTNGEDGKRVVKVKFGQLNLASKTAKYKAVLTSDSASGFSFEYNGVPLTQGIDYTVTKVKQDRKTGKYTVTIKAVKGKQCSYKGSRSIKNLDITSPTN
jgi:hypothetical protein